MFFGEKCEYLHKESKFSADQIKIKERIDQLEEVVKDKLTEEKKMLHAIKELERMIPYLSHHFFYEISTAGELTFINYNITKYHTFKATPITGHIGKLTGDTKPMKNLIYQMVIL